VNLVEHKNRDDYKVWLSESELDQLIAHPDDAERELALALGGKCGLRSHEILQVAPKHVHETDVGTMLTVPEGKGDKRRETPIPEGLAGQIRTAGHYSGDDAASVVSVTETRTLRHWIKRAREELGEEHRDDWQHVTMHDLRRTWATQLASKDVDPLVVCQWGGWNDLDTFLEHYQGAMTPEAQKRERKKVEWL